MVLNPRIRNSWGEGRGDRQKGKGEHGEGRRKKRGKWEGREAKKEREGWECGREVEREGKEDGRGGKGGRGGEERGVEERRWKKIKMKRK